MTHPSKFAGYSARLRAGIHQTHRQTADGRAGENVFTRSFEAFALELFALQFEANTVYRQFCEGRTINPGNVFGWREIPAIPAVTFKEFELTSIPGGERTRVFRSSGTTEQRPSRHFHDAESLALYEDSALPWFAKHLDLDLRCGNHTDDERIKIISLTPLPEQAPHSSLVHMLRLVSQEFAPRTSVFVGRAEQDGAWSLDLHRAVDELADAVAANLPVLLMGTAFNFVHLLDHLQIAGRRYELPAGSRVMETGGYKGRSRILSKTELHALITRCLGVKPGQIVCEYGMSELSSQAYDRVAQPAAVVERRFQFPPWARALVVSPESGLEVQEGETGLLRIYDLANLRSVLAIQTEDLAIRRGDGFELIGRAALAENRGCSLMSA